MAAGHAIPFIALTNGKFEVTPEADEFLRTIDTPVAVISVVGLYRTGKSFLLNRILLQQPGGFQVGPTVNPCTKGLWIWNKVLEGEDKEGNPVKYIIVDTEGIGALDTNSQHDSIIFSLALLLSSYFVYNSVGSIDEGALNNLSLVVNLTKHIHVRSNAQGGEDDGSDFAQYFPAFLWLVRDFTLQLVTPDGQAFTAKEYLERALQPAPGFTEQIEAKNRIRRMLTHFFPDRDCFTMVRPVTDESLLQRLSETPSEKLRPEFVDQMKLLRNTILGRAEPKKMNGTALDGVALINLAYAYTESINTGSVPSIQNAWNYICESKCQGALTDAIAMYEKESKVIIEKKLPMTLEDLEDLHKDLESKSFEHFTKQAIGTDTDEYKRKLEDKIRELYRTMQQENSARGRDRAKEILEKLYAEVDGKVQADGFENFDEYETERRKVRTAYMEEAPNGPFKVEVLSSFMEQKLSDCGSKFSSKFQLELQREQANAKALVDEKERELVTAKMEAEKDMGNVKLKLEYAEKYNEDAKQREKENKEEMASMRNKHEEALKSAKEKAEQELKSQVSAIEEKRAKAQQEAQKFEQDLLQYKKDQEMNMALLQQEKDFAKKSAEDSATREAELRKLLENAKKDAENETKALLEKFETEKGSMAKSIQTLTENSEKTAALASEWEEKHAALGVQLTSQIKQKDADIEEKQKEIIQLSNRVQELEAEGGKKAKAENEQLNAQIQTLQEKIDSLSSEKTSLQNSLTVSQEEKARLDTSSTSQKKDLREAEEKVKALSAKVESLERDLSNSEDANGVKSGELDKLSKQLDALNKEKAAREKELTAGAHQASEKLEELQRTSEEEKTSLESKCTDLEAQLEELQQECAKQKEDLETLAQELEAAESKAGEGLSQSEDQWKAKLKEQEEKARRKQAELSASSETALNQMKEGFRLEKEALDQRIKMLENKARDAEEDLASKQSELEAHVAEYETALDELEKELRTEMEDAAKQASAEYADLKEKSFKIEADLTKQNEGLSSRNSVIEAQLTELKATSKQEKADMENRYTSEMREYRADAEARIKKLEQDLSSTMAKNEMLNNDLVKAAESSETRMREMSTKFSATQEKLEAEKKELQRTLDESQKELQAEVDYLKSELKRHENEKIMATKDHETELALLKSHISNLEKQLKEREAVVRDLEQSKEAEVSDARTKLQTIKAEDEARMQKEREENKARFEELKTKSEDKIRTLKEDLNAKSTELKVLEERIEGFKSNEAKLTQQVNESKARLTEEKDSYSTQLKQLKEQLSTVQKELQDEKGEHQMTRLRSEKQEEWDRRELAQLKDELADKKKVMDNMISKDIYKRDLDAAKGQHQNSLADITREKESERAALEAAKKKLEEELTQTKAVLKKANTEGVMTEAKQKEFTKLTQDRERIQKELDQAKAELDTQKKAVKGKDEELRRKEAEYVQAKDQMKPIAHERDEIKKERDELETKVMKLEMEIKNIQQIEERKYQVEVMRLKTENEELKRADKKKQQIEPKAPMTEEQATAAAAPALSTALARVRARRTTAQGGPPK